MNSIQQDPARLPGTVHALRIQLAQITRTLGQLECDLTERIVPATHSTVRCSYKVGYVLYGQEFRVSNGTQLLIEVLQHFSELDPDFSEHYRVVLQQIGHRRPYVARSREALYPGNPHLVTETAEYAPGWFVGTNEGNDKKLRLLHIACQVLGLQWGQDLIVRMP